MNKQLGYKIILVLIVGVFASVLTACTLSDTETSTSPLEPVTLKLNWHHGIQFLGFYVAQDQGYYAEEGLAVTIEPLEGAADSANLAMNLAAGEYDFATGTFSNIMQAFDEGERLVTISAVYQFNPTALFARADSGIITPKDLAGRSIVIKNPNWQAFVEGLLEHAGLTLDDVEPVPGGFDMTPFFEGEVEVWAGFLTNEVIRARLQGIELVTFPLHEYGIEISSTVILVSQASLADKPDRAVRFLRASLRGWEWAVENPTEAVDIMLESFPEKAAERDFHLASFDASIPLVRPPGIRVGTLDCEQWAGNELLAELGPLEAYCTNTILSAVWGEN
jgi:NitT/TauT family transport system substrate-binding protein